MSSDKKVLVMVMEGKDARAMLREELDRRPTPQVSRRKGAGQGGKGGKSGKSKAKVVKRKTHRPAPVGRKVLWQGHQLIGDSMLSRVAQQSLNQSTSFSQTLKKKQLGLCVHGFTTNQMARYLRGPNCPSIEKKAIVLLGTNDVLKGVPIETTLKGLGDVVQILIDKTEMLVMSTIPPIPKLSDNETPGKIKKINDAILNLGKETGGKVKVVDAAAHFCDGEEVKMELFSKTYGDGRVDLVHWSRAGVKAWEEAMLLSGVI